MSVTILIGGVREQLRTLADNSIHCCVTSPPYWGLRNYGVDGQIGLEATPAEFIAVMVDVFEEVRRVLRPDGTCWINMGDSYAANRGYQVPDGKVGDVGNSKGSKVPVGLKPKDLCMMPHRLAIALQDAGWWVRQDCVWSKPNPMPESVRDRCTKSHEYIFLLTKSAQYYYDAEAINEPSARTGDTAGGQGRKDADFAKAHGDAHRGSLEGAVAETRNKRSVWTMATHSFAEAHFATFPPELPEICIKAGTSEYGVCSDCGAPWVRTTNVSYTNPGNRSSNGPRSIERRHEKPGFEKRLEKRVETTGWTSTCACEGASVVRATVLDPFFGAGTSGLVADRLQRDCIGIELNPAYAEIARKRIQGESPLFAEVASTAPEPMRQEQASFAEVP